MISSALLSVSTSGIERRLTGMVARIKTKMSPGELNQRSSRVINLLCTYSSPDAGKLLSGSLSPAAPKVLLYLLDPLKG